MSDQEHREFYEHKRLLHSGAVRRTLRNLPRAVATARLGVEAESGRGMTHAAAFTLYLLALAGLAALILWDALRPMLAPLVAL